MKVIKRIIPILIAIMMAISLAACDSANTGGSQSTSGETEQTKTFPKFQGTDFDGNSVDESLFSKNEVTLLNFWFNGCSACVNEMPALEELNIKLREKNAELVGVNVEAGESDKALIEAKKILTKQGATYRNLFISGGDEAKEYIGKIFGFPTTVLVDKNGNIIGNPIVGSIEEEKRMDEILKMVDDVKAGKAVSVPKSKATNDDKMAALVTEENNIFLDHKEVWDKVFNNIQKDNTQDMSNVAYAEFLKTQIGSIKNLFSEDELKTLYEDITRIGKIEKEIEALDNNKDNNS